MYMNGQKYPDALTSRYLTKFLSKSVHGPKNICVFVEDLLLFEKMIRRNIFINTSLVSEYLYLKKILLFSNHVMIFWLNHYQWTEKKTT